MRSVQSTLGLACLIAVIATCAGLSVLSRSESVRRWTEGPELQRFINGGGIYMNRGGFVDFEDRLLLDEVPSTDFTRGGVYFFGTSTTKWALSTWDLPADVRPLVHNFGIGASNHTHTAQLIQHLIDHEGLLRAGSRKVHVVVGCFWGMGKEWPRGFFDQLWGRYGLYRYDEQAGIALADLGPVQRLWRLEQARVAGFVTENARRAARAAATAVGVRGSAESEGRIAPADIRRRAFENASVPHWERELDGQEEQMRKVVRQLRDRGVEVTMVLMPIRQVYEELPFPREYNRRMRDLAREDSVPIVDLSRLLGEDEFVDVNHANYAGLKKLDKALMDIAQPHLQRLRGDRP